jgi:hypothetical protein
VTAEEAARWERLQGVRTGEVLVSLAWSPALAASPGPLPGGRYTLAVLIDSCTGLGPGKGQPPRLCLCEATLGDTLATEETRKRSTFRKNIKHTFKRSSQGSRERKESFRTSLRPLSALYGASSGYVWRESHFFLGEEVVRDRLSLTVVSSKDSVVGRLQLAVAELQPGVARLERQLEEPSRPGATLLLSTRLLYY